MLQHLLPLSTWGGEGHSGRGGEKLRLKGVKQISVKQISVSGALTLLPLLRLRVNWGD